MNTSPCLALSRSSDLQTVQPAASGREVRLRTSCVVEYAVQLTPDRNGDSSPAGGSGHGKGMVLLSVYVPHCMLNPDQVRIVEV